MINVLTIIIAFWVYVLLVYLDFGVQKTISASYYSWPEDNSKPWTPRLMFMLMCIICGVNFMIIMGHWYGWLAGSSLAIVGLAANFRNKLTGIIHNVGALTAIVVSLLSLYLHFGHWWNLLFPVAAVIFSVWAYKKLKNATWYIEEAVMTLIQIGLLINL